VYKPLPKEVTIKESSIDGLGLFATEDIKEGHDFGTSHVSDVRFEDGFLRTTLGGFINHSEEPNCKLVSKKLTPNWVSRNMLPFSQEGECLSLIAREDIPAETELTTKYSLYRFGVEHE